MQKSRKFLRCGEPSSTTDDAGVNNIVQLYILQLVKNKVRIKSEAGGTTGTGIPAGLLYLWCSDPSFW